MDDSTDNNSSPPPPAAAAASSRTISEHLALTLQTIDQLTTIFSFPPHMARQAVETVGPEDVTQCYNWILDNYQLEDCGGPVVPKLDCPHLEGCVDGNVLNKIQLLAALQSQKIDDGNNECCKEVGEDTNLFQMTCQHYSSSLMRRPTSRKRLRSEDDNDSEDDGGEKQQSVPTGQLKRDEDYDTNNNDETTTTPTKPTCCNGKENWLCLQCGILLCSRYEHGHAKLHWEDTKNSSAEFSEEKGDKKSTTVVGHCIAVSLADLSVWCYECNAYLHHDSLSGLMKCLEELKFGSSSTKEENNQQPKTMKLAAFLLASSIIIVSAAASDDSKMVRGGGGVVAIADDVDVDAIKATKHNVLRCVNFFKAIAEGEYVAGRYCDADSCNPGCAANPPCTCPSDPDVMCICSSACGRQSEPCPSGTSCKDGCSDWNTYYCE